VQGVLVSPLGQRDLKGFGRRAPNPQWPNGARIAVNFNLNYEGGGELTLVNGDTGSEGRLTDIGAGPVPGRRIPLVESVFEFGSRVGVWRVLRAFEAHAMPISILAVGRALEQNPELVTAARELGHEIVSHGWRWIDYAEIDRETERAHIATATRRLEEMTGERPLGWMTGAPSDHTRGLLMEQGGYLYDRDSLADELPFWVETDGRAHLVIPYSFETNDNRFSENTGFSTADHFFTYMKDAFDALYAEGATSPRLLSIGLHDRLIGRPARIGGLIRFLDHVAAHEDVWICRGIDIARHWRRNFAPAGLALANDPQEDAVDA